MQNTSDLRIWQLWLLNKSAFEKSAGGAYSMFLHHNVTVSNITRKVVHRVGKQFGVNLRWDTLMNWLTFVDDLDQLTCVSSSESI